MVAESIEQQLGEDSFQMVPAAVVVLVMASAGAATAVAVVPSLAFLVHAFVPVEEVA